MYRKADCSFNCGWIQITDICVISAPCISAKSFSKKQKWYTGNDCRYAGLSKENIIVWAATALPDYVTVVVYLWTFVRKVVVRNLGYARTVIEENIRVWTVIGLPDHVAVVVYLGIPVMIRVVRNLGDARIPIGRLRFLSLGTWTRRIGWWRYFIAFSRLCRSVKFLSRSCPYRTFVTPSTPTAASLRIRP